LISKAVGPYAVLGPPKGTKGGKQDVDLIAGCIWPPSR
jgi:hypothetical protein